LYCTYTQGYFGNSGGMACNGEPLTSGPSQFSTDQTITRSVNAQGGMIRIGKLGKSFTITAGANGDPASPDVAKVIDVLPGGGAAKELTHTGDKALNIIGTLSPTYLKNGRINNNLLSQTMTLAINNGIRADLKNLQLDGGTIVTAAPDGGCGSDVPMRRVCNYDPLTGALTSVTNEYSYRDIDGAVVAKAVDPTNSSLRTVGGLLALANRALGNVDGIVGSEDGVSLLAIQNTVDVINNAFDGCRILIGFNVPRCPASNRVTSVAPLARNSASATNGVTNTDIVVDKLNVSAYPNPFNDIVKFTIESPVSGQAQLEVFNMLGQKVSTVYNGFVQANKAQVVEYRAPVEAQQNLIYVLKIGGEQVTGKLLRMKR
jgi:large repetitive protein